MKTPRIPKDTPELDLEQQKQLIAYQLWEEEGRPEGKAEEHWDQACLVVMSVAEGEAAASPVWIKRQDTVTENATEKLPGVESLTKRNVARQAA
jgi:Protein of unknown function (DUF2934)